MIRLHAVVVLALFLGGCTLAQLPAKIVKRDLTRVQEMAVTHGKPATEKCATYLVEAIQGREALLAEDVDGLLSLAFKAYLLKNNIQESEDSFVAECGELAARLLLEVGRVIR